jgi:hypothetical protein
VERQADTLLSRQITQFFIQERYPKNLFYLKGCCHAMNIYFESPKMQISTFVQYMSDDGLYNTDIWLPFC